MVPDVQQQGDQVVPQAGMSGGWANAYVGTPYVPMGRDPVRDGGLDCWGLVRWVYMQEARLALPSYTDDAYDVNAPGAGDLLTPLFEDEVSDWVQVDNPRPCDAVWCVLGSQPHVGLWFDARRILHTAPGHDCGLMRMRYTPLRVRGVFRHRALLDG